MRIVFMGTPEFSVPTLAATIEAGHDVAAVYSQPPRKSGRGMATRKSPVHQFAELMGINVHTPASLRDPEEQQRFADLKPDVAVVVAYGLLLPSEVLNAPRYGCLNLHASALPRWRGAAPINRAIMAGDTETAAAVMQMEKGLDTGPVLLSEPISIPEDMTAGELHDVLKTKGAALMVKALDALGKGELKPQPQAAEGVTYASKLEKSEARLNFSKPARDVHNHIRGLSPFPGSWFELPDANGKLERIKALRSEVAHADTTAGIRDASPGTILDTDLVISCGDGAVRILEVQRAGKRPCATAEFLRGFPLEAGAKAV